VDDLNGDDRLDLMIGNGFGDVLFVLGNGDGTFRPFVRADQRVPFVTTDLDGDGTLDVVLGNQAQDLAVSQIRTAGTATFTPGAFQQDGANGLIGPGDVIEVDLDGLYGTDLVFANSGSNNVLVYLRQPDGSFADQPLSFFAGTNPTDLHAADLNGDGVPDLAVANQGSNDVSVLLTNRDPTQEVNGDGVADGGDLLRLGPRLQTGGQGPNAVTAQDQDGDGVLVLLVTNGQDGTFAVLPGIAQDGAGTGFFDDTDPNPMPLTSGPVVQTQVVSPTRGFALTPQGAVVQFNPTTGQATPVFTPAAGQVVRAFQAVTVPDTQSPLLFVARADGSVGVLLSGVGRGFTLSNAVTAPTLDDPSALQVVALGPGLFEIYVTDSGESLPLVVTLSLQPPPGSSPRGHSRNLTRRGYPLQAR
jgi:hypothetical protein